MRSWRSVLGAKSSSGKGEKKPLHAHSQRPKLPQEAGTEARASTTFQARGLRAPEERGHSAGPGSGRFRCPFWLRGDCSQPSRRRRARSPCRGQPPRLCEQWPCSDTREVSHAGKVRGDQASWTCGPHRQAGSYPPTAGPVGGTAVRAAFAPRSGVSPPPFSESTLTFNFSIINLQLFLYFQKGKEVFLSYCV